MSEPLTKDQILETLRSHDTVVFLTTGNANKQTELTRLVNDPGVPVLNIKDLATVLGTEDAKSLESSENEKDYAAIATGKVEVAKQAALASGLPKDVLSHMLILGDDYGAAAGALKFTYDETAPAFEVDFGEDGHIGKIRTNRQELDGQPAPGYFSKRVMQAVAAKHPGEADKFKPLAAEIFHAADKTGDRSTTATVAIAYGRPTDDHIGVALKTADYVLPKSIAEMPEKGFDFDRIQARAEGEKTIAEWSDAEKDEHFPRGQAVREAMEKSRSRPGPDGQQVVDTATISDEVERGTT